MDISELQANTSEVIGAQLDRLQQIALGMLVAGVVLTALGAVLEMGGSDPGGVFHSYLYAYVFWTGVTVGSLAALMLHHTVGGGWGYLIRGFLEAATRLLPLMLILFLPIVLNLVFAGRADWARLYEWALPDRRAADPIIQFKSPYLNVPFFVARTIFYFAVWMVLAYFLNKWGATQYERADREISHRLNLLSASGIIIYVLTVTFAIVDWVMSLTPHWTSSIFGMLTVVTQALSTLATMVLLLAFLAGDKPLLEEVPSKYFRDLGNLMLAFVMLWAYMSFSQYLIQYSGNTYEEIGWYLDRRSNGWGVISLALIPLHFLLPFLILVLGSHVKRNPSRLARVALFLVVMRLIDIWWWVTPTFRKDLLHGLSPADIGTPLLIGGIWLWFWAGQVRGRPVVPLHDPRLEAALQEAAQHG